MYWMSSMAVSASSCRLGNTTCNRRRTCGTVSAAAFFFQKAALPNQKVMRQQCHGHMMVPAFPPTHLILVHAHLALALQDRQLYWPAPPALVRERGVRRRGWRSGQIGFQLRLFAQR